MARRSLIVGINNYGGGGNDLHACIADAEAMTAVLARHKDGERNFDCLTWSDKTGDGAGNHPCRAESRANQFIRVRWRCIVLLFWLRIS